MRNSTLGFGGGIAALSCWKCYNAKGWWGRGGFGFLAVVAAGAIKLWQVNSRKTVYYIYLLPDGKQIEVHFLGIISPTILTLPIRDIKNTTDSPEFEVLTESVNAYIVTLHNGEFFSLDLKAIVPDRKLLGAVLQGEPIDIRQDQDTISV